MFGLFVFKIVLYKKKLKRRSLSLENSLPYLIVQNLSEEIEMKKEV